MSAIKPKATANPDQPPLRQHLINIKELAFVLGRSAESLSRDDKAGTIPASIKLGSSVRWDWNEILAWVKAKCPDRKTWEARAGNGETSEPKAHAAARPTTRRRAHVMNEDDVYIWLNQVIEPSSVIELRILNAVENPRYPPFTLSGYFDCSHLDTLVGSAMEWTHKAEGIYVTINPVNPALLARAYNRVVRKPKNTTTDADIVGRVGLVFDADPVRPAGISATAEEKALARERIDCLMVGLTRRGWPYPILADSGNGFHAHYRVDLPTADGGLVSRVLKAADVLFSDKRVKIDTSLSNASRIVKLYGTMSQGGRHAGSPTPMVPDALLSRGSR